MRPQEQHALEDRHLHLVAIHNHSHDRIFNLPPSTGAHALAPFGIVCKLQDNSVAYANLASVKAMGPETRRTSFVVYRYGDGLAVLCMEYHARLIGVLAIDLG